MTPADEDGYELWLRHARLDEAALTRLGDAFDEVVLPAKAPKLELARRELAKGLAGLVGRHTTTREGALPHAGVCLASTEQVPLLGGLVSPGELTALGDEGFLLRRVKRPEGTLTLI